MVLKVHILTDKAKIFDIYGNVIIQWQYERERGKKTTSKGGEEEEKVKPYNTIEIAKRQGRGKDTAVEK